MIEVRDFTLQWPITDSTIASNNDASTLKSSSKHCSHAHYIVVRLRAHLLRKICEIRDGDAVQRVSLDQSMVLVKIYIFLLVLTEVHYLQ